MATTIEDLYQQVLGRAPDPGGLLNWQNAFGTGPLTQEEINLFVQSAAPELAVTHYQPNIPIAAPNQQSLQATNPALYNSIVNNLQSIADESWGGKIQPYQYQIIAPLDTSQVNAPKQLEKEPAVYRTVQTDEGPQKQLVSGGNIKGANPLYDENYNITGYTSKNVTYVNQIPIVAKIGRAHV